MSNDIKTLADAQPGGGERLGDQAERARFEACAHAQSYRGGNILTDRDANHPDVYADPLARLAWKIRQSALSAQPSPGDQGGCTPAFRGVGRGWRNRRNEGQRHLQNARNPKCMGSVAVPRRLCTGPDRPPAITEYSVMTAKSPHVSWEEKHPVRSYSNDLGKAFLSVRFRTLSLKEQSHGHKERWSAPIFLPNANRRNPAVVGQAALGRKFEIVNYSLRHNILLTDWLIDCGTASVRGRAVVVKVLRICLSACAAPAMTRSTLADELRRVAERSSCGCMASAFGLRPILNSRHCRLTCQIIVEIRDLVFKQDLTALQPNSLNFDAAGLVVEKLCATESACGIEPNLSTLGFLNCHVGAHVFCRYARTYNAGGEAIKQSTAIKRKKS